MTVSPADLPYLYLTTTGWKSGRPHEIEIWFVAYNGAYYLVSERRERSHWVQNIRHNPAISFRLGETHYHGTGRIIDNAAEPELAAAVSRLMDDKYGWSSGLIVELKPA
ncbi:MAG TPA: nitroreductase/quinone reductase family protein [Spirillospora sp.]|nr:nitroreductase/quinone reductase family protein [Spirillospora sp.]